MDSLTIILDLPPPDIHQNNARRGHWSVKSAAIKAYRDAAHAEAKARGLPASCPWREFSLSVQFVYPLDKRSRDVLNYLAALKPAIDGLEDAGVFYDDCGLSIDKVPLPTRGAEPCVYLHLQCLDGTVR